MDIDSFIDRQFLSIAGQLAEGSNFRCFWSGEKLVLKRGGGHNQLSIDRLLPTVACADPQQRLVVASAFWNLFFGEHPGYQRPEIIKFLLMEQLEVAPFDLAESTKKKQ